LSKILTCPKCDFETTETLAKCPQCGRRLQSKKKVRILGWVLVVLGLFLVIFMSGLGIMLASIIVQSDQPGATSRFTGGPQDILFIVAIFGFVIAFGLATIVGGAWQIWYGKPNRKLMVAMLLLLWILWGVATVIRTYNRL
jgi:hypothetical protein